MWGLDNQEIDTGINKQIGGGPDASMKMPEQQLYQRIRGGNHAAFRKELSKETKTLIKGLLSPDPSARFTSEYTAKQPFFARVEALDSRRDELEI